MVKNLLSAIFLFFSLSLHAVDFYWVGGEGDWSDPTNWSHQSGGSAGQGIPGPTDNVIFDGSSFNLPGKTVSIKGNAECNSLKVLSSSKAFSISGKNQGTLTLNGNLLILRPLKGFDLQKVTFKGNGNTIIEANGTRLSSDLTFDGPGSWVIASDIRTSKTNSIELVQGHLETKGFTVSTGTFRTTGDHQKELTPSSSKFLIHQGWYLDRPSKVIYAKGKESILLPPGATSSDYRKGGKDYNDFGLRDNTCGSITISPAVVSDYNGKDISCNDSCDAEVTVTVSGGSGSYSYDWVGGPKTQNWSGLCSGTYGVFVTDDSTGTTCYDEIQVTEPSEVTAYNLTTNDPTCPDSCDGEADMTPIGGTSPYVFQWSSGETTQDADSLCVGSNSLTITDANGCIFDTTISISDPPPIQPNVTVTDASCFGVCDGTADSDPLGGNGAPWSYSWSTGDNVDSIGGLCDGNYSLMVFDSAGCQKDTTITVNEPLQLQISVTNTQDLLCNSECIGSISVSVSNGTAPYSYAWYDANTGNPISPQQDSSTAIDLCAGDYYVEVTDANGCQETSSNITITQPPPIVHDTAFTNVSCNGACDGVAIIDSTGGGTPGYSYEWFDASTGSSIGQTDTIATNLCAGSYYAEITDANGCTVNSDTFQISEPPELSLSTTHTDILCNGDCTGEIDLSISGGTQNYNIDWINASTGSPIGQTDSTATNLCSGDYYAEVVDAKGCIDTTDTVTIDEPAPLSFNMTSSNITCNGDCDGTAEVNISGGVSPYNVDWIDANTGSSIGQSDTLATNLCPGDYYADITDANGCTLITDTVTITQPAPLSANFNVTHVSCGGNCDGSITANPSGGTSPYTYQWFNSSTGNPLGSNQTQGNLCPGDYYVEITDANGCTFTSNDITITEPAPLSLSTSSVAASCSDTCDGLAIADVSGGTTPYTYNWTDGAGNPIGVNNDTLYDVCAGTYNISIVDDNGCSIGPQNINVPEPAPLDPTLSITDASCDGDCDGEASVSVSGGTPSYSYVWSTGGTGSSETNLCAGTFDLTVTDQNSCDTTVSFTVEDPPSLSISVTPSDVSCNGDCDGSAEVSISGGTTPYNIQWLDQSGNPIPGETDSTINGLCAGTYGVEVTDSNNCSTQNTSVTINEPASLSVNLNVTNVSCNGNCDGSITANPNGGTSPYDYQWYNANTGFPLGTNQTQGSLCPGDYYVEVTDANGCTITSNTVTITQPNALSLTTSTTDVSCNGQCDGSATANVSGGTTPYDYSWVDGNGNPIGNSATVNNLCAGTYQITIQDDNGCTIGPQNVTINEPSPLQADLSSQDVSCNGACDGSASVSTSGGTSPYSYSWSNGGNGSSQNNLCPGSYSVTVSDDNNCDTTINFTISEPGPLSVSINSTDPSCSGACDGSAIASISGGTTPYDIQWYDGSGNPISGDTSNSVSGYCDGSYTVEVIDSNGCTESASMNLNAPTVISSSIDSTQNASCGVSCDGAAWISFSGGSSPYTIEWFDATTGNSTGITEEDPDSLCSGNYYAVITDDNNCSVSTDTIIISEDVVITGTITTSDASCFGYCDGSASVSPSGGSTPYSYTWINTSTGDTVGASQSINGLCSDGYAVTVTDANGCSSAPITTTVGENSLLEAQTDCTVVSCSNGSDGTAIVTPTGGTTPYDYQWDANANNQTDSIAQNLSAGTYQVTITDNNGCSLDTSVTVTEPSPVSSSLNIQNASCNGNCDGMATVSPSGGTVAGSYSIQWYDGSGNPIPGATNDTLSSLCAGSYSVAVSDDNNCTDSVAFTINEPNALTASISNSSDISCNGADDGAATVSPSGGTSPYTYSWNDPSSQTTQTASNLPPGSYTVTVTDDNGCSTSASVTINEPAPLDFNTTTTDVTCNGDCDGQASVVNVTGGTGPYSYSWNDPLNQNNATAIQLCAGTYQVTVTDANGCDSTASVTINEPTAISITVDNTTNPTCYNACDGSINVSVSGGTGGYSYDWVDQSTGSTVSSSEDPSGLCDGTYELTVTDANGCTQSTSVTLTEPAEMTASFSTVNSNCGACDGEATINVGNGVPPYSYNWSPAPGGGQGTDNATGLCAQVYTVDVTDDNGCTKQFSVSISDNGAETTTTDSTTVSCNGSCDGTASVTIVGGCSDPSCSIDWLDSTGTSIGQSGNNATGLCEGTYYAEVTNGSGCITLNEVIITGPNALEANLSTTDASCGGTCDGEGTVTPTGGTAPYTYSWSSGNTPSDSTNGGLCAGNHTVTVTDANGCDTTIDFTINEPTPLDVSTTDSTNVSCNGGSDGTATVFPSGGTPGYAYEWYDCSSNSPIGQTTQQATGLSAGSYYVVVTDAGGCLASTSCITITQPSPLSANTTIVQNITCNGAADGQAQVDVTGGTVPYSYQWVDNNGNPVPGGTDTLVTNLDDGTYTVTVTDDNGCQTSASVTLNEPAPLSSSTSTTDASCNSVCDGEANISVSGGSLPYSYQWFDNNGNPLPGDTTSTLIDCAGDYTVEVTDGNGCMITRSVTINEPPALNLTTSTDNGTCNNSCNGSASVSVTGGNGSPYSYQWLDSLQNPIAGETGATMDSACAGDYTVVVTDAGGCQDSADVTIVEPTALTATTSSNNSTCGNCNGSASVNPTGGTAPYSYQWDANAGNQTTQMATNLCAGVYSVTVTDTNGCAGTFTVSVSDQGSENVTTDSTDVSCYGSCDGTATANFTCSDSPCTVEWYDANTGNSIGQTTTTATNLCAGDYYVEVINNSGCVAVEPVTVGDPAPLEANASLSNVSCNGACDGGVTVNPTGGVSPYSFTWTDSTGSNIGNGNSVSNLCPGDYTVNITDNNGCDTNYTYTITQPLPLSATATSTDVQCNGSCTGQASVSATGGTGSGTFSYQWLDGAGNPIPGETSANINGLCAGNYSVEVTDTNGCDTIVDVTINEPSPITANFTVQDVQCYGNCDGIITASVTGGTVSGDYSYQWYDSTGTAIPGETDSVLTGACAGDYTLEIVDDNNCNASQTVTVNEPAPLTLSIDSIAAPTCNSTCNGMISVTASGGSGSSADYSYQWFDDNGNPLGNPDTSYKNNLCGGTYTIEVTDTNGCTTSKDTTINKPAPISATMNSNDADCGVNNGSASATNVIGGSGGYSYQWYDNSMNPIPGATSSSINNLGAGIYNLEITDANGCTDIFSVTINNVNAPSITTDSIQTVTCSGGSNGAIHVSVNGGTTPYSYLWNPGGQTSQDLTNVQAGVYILELTDDAGCKVFYQDTVPQNPAMSATFASSDATCGACDGAASVSISGGTAPYSYQWTTGSTTATDSGLCAGVHSVQVTDANGCSETFDVTISNPGGPTVDNVSTTPASCNGSCNGSASVTVSGGTPPYTYNWVNTNSTSNMATNLCAGNYFVQIEDDEGCITTRSITITEPSALKDSAMITPATCGACDGEISLFVSGGTPSYSYSWSTGSTNPQVSNLCEGIYTVTVQDNNGCSKTFTYPISGSNAPQVNATGTDVSCSGDCDGSATATVTGSSTVTYEWFDGNGNTTGQTSPNANGLCPGDYTIEVTDTSTGCQAYDQVTIEEPDSLYFNIPNTQDASCNGVCDGSATVSVTGGTLPYDLQWSNGDSTATVNNLCAGNYTATLTDGNGCTADQDLTIDEPAPVSITVDSVNSGTCSNSNNGSIYITVSGGDSPYSYNWSGPSGFTSNSEDITGLTPGDYIIDVTDTNGCSSTDTMTVNAAITVTADGGPDTAVCQGGEILLVGTGGVTSQEWLNMSGTQISSEDSVTVSPTSTAQYLFVAYNSPCSDTDTVEVSIYAEPNVDAGPDQSILQGEVAELGGLPTGPTGSSYEWTPATGLGDSSEANPTVEIEEEGNYTYYVTVVTPEGCIGTDSVNIEVLPDIKFPDGFTPNGDGVNDVWEIDYIDEFPNAVVEVYNRWGEMLFRSEGYEEPWDGTFNGKPVPVGTYYYVIDLNDPTVEKQKYTGPITILR